MKMKRSWLLIVGLVVLMVCLWGTLVEPFVRAALRQRAQRDRIYLRTACFTAKQVYERAGILYTDLESVVSSPFFPFVPPVVSCSGSNLTLTVREDQTSVVWSGSVQGNHDHRSPPTARATRLTQEERTRRQLALLAEGPEAWRQFVAEVRAAVAKQLPVQSLPKPWRDTCGGDLLSKSLPPSLLLSKGIEVTRYEQWLREFWGDVVLHDAWGNHVRFAWDTGRLRLSSAGADGVWGTADDIRAEREFVK